MKLVTFSMGPSDRTGVLLESGNILDLALAAQAEGRDAASFQNMLTLIEGGQRVLDFASELAARQLDSAIVPIAKARLRSPIRPPRMRDTLMFLEHMENGLDKWARNLAAKEADPEGAYQRLKDSGRYDLLPIFRQKVIYYNANHLSVSGYEDMITWPTASTHADFGLELACVIGRVVHGVEDESDAEAAIFGYTIYNDWSARDLQLDFMQANLGPAGGKDFPGGNTLGPCIVTLDEMGDVSNLSMVARVNGKTLTRGSTASMHHSFPHAIAEFSRVEELVPGEVMGSGTVLNGCGYEHGLKLNDGDIVELEIENIGILRNTISIL